MVSKRVFYKTIVTITVLSEGPADFDSLTDLAYQIDEGEWVGAYEDTSERIDGGQCALELLALGSDSTFFQLTADGDDYEG